MTTATDRYVAAQNGAVRLAVRDLRTFWGRLDHSDPLASRVALERFWPVLLARYGEITATLAVDRFEDLTGLPGVMVRPVDAERANARMGWAMGPAFRGDPDASYALLAGLVDELVKQAGRSSMIASSRERHVRYARVPTGRETCAFCLMLASRGAVYASERSASSVTGDHLGGTDYRKLGKIGDTPENRAAILRGARSSTKARGGRRGRATSQALGSKFHSHCDCRVEPVVDQSDMNRLAAEGYDLEGLRRKYSEARSATDSGDPKKILAAMRENESIH